MYHDLYKLEVAPCKKALGHSEDDPQLFDAEHVHFFHTVDSNGKILSTSGAIAGHFHEMEVIPNEDPTLPPKVRCASGPMQMVKRKVKGRYVKVAEPVVIMGELDDHTHQVTYLRSDLISHRTINPQAVNIQAQEAQKTAPIPGVAG